MKWNQSLSHFGLPIPTGLWNPSMVVCTTRSSLTRPNWESIHGGLYYKILIDKAQLGIHTWWSVLQDPHWQGPIGNPYMVVCATRSSLTRPNWESIHGGLYYKILIDKAQLGIHTWWSVLQDPHWQGPIGNPVGVFQSLASGKGVLSNKS